MEKSISLRKQTRIICPECSNYIVGRVQDNGTIIGECHICKSVISSKQCSTKVKQIKVIKI